MIQTQVVAEVEGLLTQERIYYQTLNSLTFFIIVWNCNSDLFNFDIPFSEF